MVIDERWYKLGMIYNSGHWIVFTIFMSNPKYFKHDTSMEHVKKNKKKTVKLLYEMKKVDLYEYFNYSQH